MLRVGRKESAGMEVEEGIWRAIIIIARHNSAGLSTAAGTDWTPDACTKKRGKKGGHPRMGDYRLRWTNDKKDFDEKLPTA